MWSLPTVAIVFAMVAASSSLLRTSHLALQGCLASEASFRTAAVASRRLAAMRSEAACHWGETAADSQFLETVLRWHGTGN